MREKILVSGILFILFLFPATFDLNSSPQNTFEVSRVYNYVDENKIMHVLGELKNIGNEAMTNVTVGSTFFDSEGKIINEYKRSAELRTINPGFISPFEILYIDQRSVDKINDFEIYVNGTRTRSSPVDLQITISSSRQDILGFYYINGVIFNNGPAIANNSIAIATLYDEDGRVIAIGRGLAEPKDIPSNSGASFGLAILDKLQTYKGDSYSVIADSDPYVSNSTIAEKK
ncbi:MAG TPA: hypothetical protein VE130_02595 [Nitrososphaeraceae archaeon]|nr:hypothetical protein [Nitrososphaeraceae archaeon]